MDLPFTPESDFERAICADPEWQAGAAWGTPRPGHGEGSVANHVAEVLANVDRVATSAEERSQLRLIAIIHDAMKHLVDDSRPKSGDNNHAVLARRFAERFTADREVLEVIELHDEAYNAWRGAAWKGRWAKAEARAEQLVARLGGALPLFLRFYRADNRTVSKEQEPLIWFEGWLRKTGRVVPPG